MAGDAVSINSTASLPPVLSTELTVPSANRIAYNAHSAASSTGVPDPSSRSIGETRGASMATDTHKPALSIGSMGEGTRSLPSDDSSLSPKAVFSSQSFSRSPDPSPSQQTQGYRNPSKTANVAKSQFLTIQDLQEVSPLTPFSLAMPDTAINPKTTPTDPNFIFHTQPSPSSYDRQPLSNSRRPSYASQMTTSSIDSSRSRRIESDDVSFRSSSPAGDEEAASNATSRANSTATATISSSRSSSRVHPMVFPQPVC